MNFSRWKRATSLLTSFIFKRLSPTAHFLIFRNLGLAKTILNDADYQKQRSWLNTTQAQDEIAEHCVHAIGPEMIW